jgi:hypothetical protein
VRQLVDDLGRPLVRVRSAGGELDQSVTGVVIHDHGRSDEWERGCVVLGVGIGPGSALVSLAEEMRRAGVVGLVVKPPLPDEVDNCRIPILEINPGASWMHVASTIRERLLEQSRTAEPAYEMSGDLFDIANTIGDAISAPITIEDHASNVLAWSTDQHDTDDARVETILGRVVNRRWLEQYEARGVFRQLHREKGPVFIEPGAPGLLPRSAIAVRAGADVLGYVWAAVSAPLTAQQAEELRALVPVVALHMVSARTGAGYAKQHRSELAATAVGGGQPGRDAARRLNLGRGPVCVLAASACDDGWGQETTALDTVENVARLRRFENSFALFLAATHPSAATVVQGEVVYALLCWPRHEPADALAAAERLARDFRSRSPQGEGYAIAVGGPAVSVEEISTARAQADAVLTAMRSSGALGSVGTPESMALPVLLQQLAERVGDLGWPQEVGPLRRLTGHEGPGGELARTLAAYVEAGGVTEDAAAALRVHVNTVRYRLRRIRAVARLDLHDADAMLLVHLQLRMRALRDSRL